MKTATFLTIIWMTAMSAVCDAQQRPLRTEDPNLIEPRHVLVEVGFDFFKGAKFPLSGLGGDLSRVGDLSVHIGLSPRVEIQFAASAQNFLDVKAQSPSVVSPQLSRGGTSSSDFGDLSVATKIALLKEKSSGPAVSLLWRVELPTSNEQKGIGTNTTNFFAEFLVGKQFGRLRTFGKLGVGILQSPAELFDQNDVLTYAGATLYRLHKKVNFVAEVSGRKNTRGLAALSTESRSQARYGLQVSWGGVRWDMGGMVGLNRNSPANGILFGVTIDRQVFSRQKRTSAGSGGS